MGPRPARSRHGQISSYFQDDGDSFNGAATARSRMDTGPAPKTPVEAAASMGPRPLGRGWRVWNAPFGLVPISFNGAATARSRMDAESRVQPPGSRASMGPRPLGRGWASSTSLGLRPSRCFNGAATARSRMVPGALPVRYQPLCFNGAATARSRMDAAQRCDARRGRAASMGPRPLGRGWTDTEE